MSCDDFDAVRPLLEQVELKPRSLLLEINKRVDHVYFVERGVVSRVARGSEGPIETAIVGRFGFVGVSVVLGSGISFDRSVVQIPGSALRIRSEDLLQLLQDRPAIRECLLGYVQALMTQNSQSVLCAAKHELEQRLARWLLLASDRLENDILPVTHDLLSTLLGVRRAGVTVALAEFEVKGIVKKTRGYLQIVDRAALEHVSCDCYRAISAAYNYSSADNDHHLHEHEKLEAL